MGVNYKRLMEAVEAYVKDSCERARGKIVCFSTIKFSNTFKQFPRKTVGQLFEPAISVILHALGYNYYVERGAKGLQYCVKLSPWGQNPEHGMYGRVVEFVKNLHEMRCYTHEDLLHYCLDSRERGEKCYRTLLRKLNQAFKLALVHFGKGYREKVEWRGQKMIRCIEPMVE